MCMVNYFGDLKLGDFGSCFIFEDENTKCKEFIGTNGYMAPEVVEIRWSNTKLKIEGYPRRFTDGYTNAIDWWGVAVILYQMAMGFKSGRPYTLPKSCIHLSYYGNSCHWQLSFKFFIENDQHF